MGRPNKEEWEDGVEGECEMCGDFTVLQDCLDPFMSEIYEEEVDMGLVCRECYLEREEDI